MESLGPINLGGLIVLGFALMWTVRLVYGRRRATADDAVKQLLLIGAWLLVALGTAGVIIGMTGPLSLFLLLATPVIVLMCVAEYRASERRSLLFALATAAEKGLPLEAAARNFALERDDSLGYRAARLADALAAGAPLPAALARTGHPLPLDALLAVRVGYETGSLGPALRHVARTSASGREPMRAILQKLFYLLVLVNVAAGILTFVMLKIIPVYKKMFLEFDLELPGATVVLVNFSDVVVNNWIWLQPILLPIQLLLVVGLLYYIGLLPRDFPLLGLLTRRYDGAMVMRSLAVAVDQKRPLGDMIRLLAKWYPRASVRGLLTTALRRMEQGADWREALRSVGLIRRADAAVLGAAQRAGNLRWALVEMSDSAQRRAAFHIQCWFNFLYPLAIGAAGICVGVFAIGLFMPIIALIQGLT